MLRHGSSGAAKVKTTDQNARSDQATVVLGWLHKPCESCYLMLEA